MKILNLFKMFFALLGISTISCAQKEQKRLFLAIPINLNLHAAQQLASKISEDKLGAKSYYVEKTPHITIAFIEDVSASKIGQVKNIIETAVDRYNIKKLDITIKNGAFLHGNFGNVRFFVQFDKPAEDFLKAASKEIEDQFKKIGIKISVQASPHISLGSISRGILPQANLHKNDLNNQFSKITPPVGCFCTNKIVLYESKKGNMYDPVWEKSL